MSAQSRQTLLDGYGPLVIAMVMSAVFVAHSVWAVGVRAAITSEQGGVETSALVVLALLVAALVHATPRKGWATSWPLPAGVALLLLRELDFHDWFFEPGLLHLAILGSDAPTWQKAVSLAVMAGILAVGGTLVWRYGRRFAAAIWRREGWALAIVLALGLFAVSTVIDGADRKLASWGMTLPEGVGPVLGMVEEIMELVGMLCLLWSFALWPQRPMPGMPVPGRLQWQEAGPARR